uniref:hypothetical protein n=1 Tax=Azospirillum argentinense TaxID=2970906 RepID=UPI0010BFAEB1|nr:hypothetical protein [Azospirillum argentinense]
MLKPSHSAGAGSWGGDNWLCSGRGEAVEPAVPGVPAGQVEAHSQAETEPMDGRGQAGGQDGVPLHPEFVAEAERYREEAAHFQRIQEGRFELELGFAIVHFNHRGFQPHKWRKERDGSRYRSTAPTDWSRYFGWLRLNGRLWKFNAAPPAIWLAQLMEPSGQPGKRRRSRVYWDVARYEDLLWAAFDEQMAQPELSPEQSPIWLGMLYAGRPGDQDFHAGPRYWQSDRTFVVIRHGLNGRPTEFQVGCLLPSDQDDTGMAIRVPLLEEQTKSSTRDQRRGHAGPRDDHQFKWTHMPRGVVFTAEERERMCPGRHRGEVIQNRTGRASTNPPRRSREPL